jgi:glycerol uptake facilitator-like aquaporin
MAIILRVVYTNGLKGFRELAIGGRFVCLYLFFLAFISYTSINPANTLAPALLYGILRNMRILNCHIC